MGRRKIGVVKKINNPLQPAPDIAAAGWQYVQWGWNAAVVPGRPAGWLGMADGVARKYFKKKMCVPDSSEGQSRGWLGSLIGRESMPRRGAAVTVGVG